MSDMISYLDEYGSIPFSQRGFGDADAVVLTQLCYCKFDSLVMGDDPVYMRDIIQNPDLDELFIDPKYDRQNRMLVARIFMGRRFRNMRLMRYVNIVDKETETQFSAVTFLLPGGISFVAFRGTDESMVGWKEDFNLSYMKEIPGQKYACMYLNEVSGVIKGKFYVGGHSKGGHLAIYSCMHSDPSLQKRFIKIYCMDGPGFMKEMVSKEGYDRIRDRIVKIIPQSSLIGLAQERFPESCRVIKSNTWGFNQHNMYTWQFENGDLEPDELREGAKFFADTLNNWMLQLDTAKRKKASEITYRIMTGSEADNRIDFMANFTANATSVLNTIRDLDPEAADLIQSLLKSLLNDMRQNLKNELGTEGFTPVKEWIEEHIPSWVEKLKKPVSTGKEQI